MSSGLPSTFSLSGLSKEDAYNKIEVEMSRLKDQIRSLLSLRNTLSPVSNLPNELLTKIFMHCCDFDESGTFSSIRPVDGDGEDDRAMPEMRLVVSWVSHHWRRVALGHKQLWNLIINLHRSPKLDYVHSCAKRCQHLFFDLASPKNRLLDACIANISQAAYLKLDLSSQTTALPAITSGSIWSRQAPHLHTLNLVSTRIRRDDTDNSHYPKLQTLILENCTFRWKFILSLASSISTIDIRDPQRTMTVLACVELLSSLLNRHDLREEYQTTYRVSRAKLIDDLVQEMNYKVYCEL